MDALPCSPPGIEKMCQTAAVLFIILNSSQSIRDISPLVGDLAVHFLFNGYIIVCVCVCVVLLMMLQHEADLTWREYGDNLPFSRFLECRKVGTAHDSIVVHTGINRRLAWTPGSYSVSQYTTVIQMYLFLEVCCVMISFIHHAFVSR